MESYVPRWDGFSPQDRHVTNVLEGTCGGPPYQHPEKERRTYPKPQLSLDCLRAPLHVWKVTPAMGQLVSRRVQGTGEMLDDKGAAARCAPTTKRWSTRTRELRWCLEREVMKHDVRGPPQPLQLAWDMDTARSDPSRQFPSLSHDGIVLMLATFLLLCPLPALISLGRSGTTCAALPHREVISLNRAIHTSKPHLSITG